MTVSNEQIEAIRNWCHHYCEPFPPDSRVSLLVRHCNTLLTALAERDATINRIQSAALSLADANTRASSVRLEAAKRLEAECSPEHVESQRAANERLTNELVERDTAIANLTERMLALEDEKLASHVRFNNGILERDADIERLKQELQTNRNARNNDARVYCAFRVDAAIEERDAELSRLREALTFYADIRNHHGDPATGHVPIVDDDRLGDRARVALGIGPAAPAAAGDNSEEETHS